MSKNIPAVKNNSHPGFTCNGISKNFAEGSAVEVNMGDLRALFFPQTIAIIGASPQRRKLSSFPHRYLKKHGYKGNVYVINPKHDYIDGFPSLPSLEQVPEEIDLALIMMSASEAVKALEDCAQNGVKAAVIFASGFAESGEDGRALQERLYNLGKEKGIIVCGPNSIGLANLNLNLTASFNLAFELDNLNRAPSAFITQSGALGFGVFSLAQQHNSGFNYVVSTGNEALLSAADYLDYLVKQEDVKAVALYLESIREPQRFLQACQHAHDLNKPVIVLKVGRSVAGKKGASSHTASLAGEDRVYDAFLKKAGIIRVKTVEELLHTAYLFTQSTPPSSNNVGIITGSGGAGIVTADACEEQGLNVPELSGDIQKGLSTIIPPYGASFNPVDATAEIIAKPDILEGCIEYLINSDILDIIIVLLTVSGGEQGEKIASCISRVKQRTTKPILVSWTANERLNSSALKILDEAGVPHFKTPEQCAQAAKNLIRWSESREQKGKIPSYTLLNTERNEAAGGVDKESAGIKAKALYYLHNIEGSPTEYEIKHYILKPYGIPVPEGHLIQTSQDAVDAAESIGYPVTLKIQLPQVGHKTDVGGVFLDLNSRMQVEGAFEKLMEIIRNFPEAKRKGILVEKAVPFNHELLAGIKMDRVFGPFILLGYGGIFAEVFNDVSLKLAPLQDSEAETMITELKSYPLLAGYRGKEGVPQELLCNVLVKISQLAVDLQEVVQELDINPLVSLEGKKGVMALDAALRKWG